MRNPSRSQFSRHLAKNLGSTKTCCLTNTTSLYIYIAYTLIFATRPKLGGCVFILCVCVCLHWVRARWCITMMILRRCASMFAIMLHQLIYMVCGVRPTYMHNVQTIMYIFGIYGCWICNEFWRYYYTHLRDKCSLNETRLTKRSRLFSGDASTSPQLSSRPIPSSILYTKLQTRYIYYPGTSILRIYIYTPLGFPSLSFIHCSATRASRGTCSIDIIYAKKRRLLWIRKTKEHVEASY